MKMFTIPNNPMNEALAATVHRRIDSDASYIAARAAIWRYLGWGTIILATGGAVGLGLFGYSYVTDGQAAAGKLSAMLAEALSNVVIKHSGDLKLDGNNVSVPLTTDGATVRLDTGDATVRLDPTSTVRIDPASRVKVAGGSPDLPRPTEQQMGVTAKPDSNVKVVTDYTVFKTVEYPASDGRVITGWVFHSSEDEAPSRQYCYFSREGAQTDMWVRYNIAMDGALISQPKDKEAPFDVAKAYPNCVWWAK